MKSSIIYRSMFDVISDAAVAAHPTYEKRSFSVKALIYIEHFELKTHFAPSLDCPWCCAIRSFIEHRPEDACFVEYEDISQDSE